MTEQQLAEIEQRWEKWINPKSAPKTLGGDFLILLAEVRRLIDENKKHKDAWILQQVREGNFKSEVAK